MIGGAVREWIIAIVSVNTAKAKSCSEKLTLLLVTGYPAELGRHPRRIPLSPKHPLGC
jgi:hypothetical protein